MSNSSHNNSLDKLQNHESISKLIQNCSYPKRLYILELEECQECFRMRTEYSLDSSKYKFLELKWMWMENGIFATTTFYRPVVVQELVESMMKDYAFDGISRLSEISLEK